MTPRFLTVEAVAVVAAGVSGFVDAHIWSPAYSYYSLLVLVVLDVLTNNLVEGKPMVPRNLALRLLAYTVLLAFAHGFAEHEKGLFFLSQLAMAPFVIVHMRRLIISFGKLDLVEPAVADLLQKRITRASEVAAESVPVPEPAAPAPMVEPTLPVAP
ncbi:hypothetical protein [Hymenobacter terricola]|uniref:hypothetical protein n=1 Tax=Hymenobacter terricola TaxID=2819236 RepID=UPI001B30B5B4|nr:hypothetical protein [Hymenobacter terricola]